MAMGLGYGLPTLAPEQISGKKSPLPLHYLPTHTPLCSRMQHPEAAVSQPEQGYFSPLKAVKIHFLQIYMDKYTHKPL